MTASAPAARYLPARLDRAFHPSPEGERVETNHDHEAVGDLSRFAGRNDSGDCFGAVSVGETGVVRVGGGITDNRRGDTEPVQVRTVRAKWSGNQP